MSSVFGKIIRGEIPAEKVYEDDEILAIQDINPVAKVHLLIMPKKAFSSIQAIDSDHVYLIGRIVEVAQKLAKEYQVEDSYRLLTNNGSDAGQTIFHLHFHLIGGQKLGPMG